MGRYKDSGLGIGTASSPQGNISQTDAEAKAEELARIDMLEMLEKAGVKFTPNDVIFAAKDETGQLVWLEKGNVLAGLEHILHGNGKSAGHAKDFKNAFGLEECQVAGFLEEVILHGKIVKNRIITIKGKEGYERIYNYRGNYCVVAGIGTNGFIVTAYPQGGIQ